MEVNHGHTKDVKERARLTRVEGVFTLKLDEGVSLAMLVVSVRGGRAVTSN
jgi:hypothetical protein